MKAISANSQAEKKAPVQKNTVQNLGASSKGTQPKKKNRKRVAERLAAQEAAEKASSEKENETK